MSLEHFKFIHQPLLQASILCEIQIFIVCLLKFALKPVIELALSPEKAQLSFEKLDSGGQAKYLSYLVKI